MISSALKWIANATGSGLTIVIGLLIKDYYDTWKKGQVQKADKEKLTKCINRGKEKYTLSLLGDSTSTEEEYLKAEIQNMIPHKYWDDMLDFDREGLVKRALKFIK
jgi:hypothetical protein